MVIWTSVVGVFLTGTGLYIGISRWLAAPHVARWWGEPEGELAKIRHHLTAPGIAPYLIQEAGRPVGYLQVYRADPGRGFWKGHPLPKETFGFDLFLGEADAVGRGLGTRAIGLAVAHLLAQPGARRVHVDPSPDNAAAIRAYIKAGFVRLSDIVMPGGPAAYMILEPER